MNDSVWYFEYVVKVFNEIDGEVETRSGVIPAESLTEALKALEECYDGIMEVQMLKDISEGIVFDFQDVMEGSDFDFVINRKEEV